MSPFAIFSRCYIFIVTFFTYYMDCAHSFPNVPGKQFEDCFEFIQVTENPETIEHLGLAETDRKQICVIKDTGGNSFCLVVSPPHGGDSQSVCHEFDLLDMKMWRYKYPIPSFNVVLLREDYVRWYHYNEVSDYNDIKRFYSLMKYDSHERNLRELAGAIDLQKKTGITSDYEVFATRPSIYIDESVEGVDVIHIVDSRTGVNEPLIIIWPLEFNIYTPEGKKVYMSLREYPSDFYFFTCASRSDADRLSNSLGQYSHDGRAIFRTNPVIFLF